MRRINPKQILKIVDIVLKHVNVIEEGLIHDRAAEIALLTGCRVVDAYYIAIAKYVNTILITNDKVMKCNTLKAGVRAYYLPNDEDYKALISKLITS